MRSSARRAARAAMATGLPIAAFTRSEMAISANVLASPGGPSTPLADNAARPKRWRYAAASTALSVEVLGQRHLDNGLVGEPLPGPVFYRGSIAPQPLIPLRACSKRATEHNSSGCVGREGPRTLWRSSLFKGAVRPANCFDSAHKELEKVSANHHSDASANKRPHTCHKPNITEIAWLHLFDTNLAGPELYLHLCHHVIFCREFVILKH